jgi:hypothetical protein
LRRIITEPGTDSPEQFARRVRLLALTYALLFTACLAGEVLLAWQGKLFVTLAQRSNVETLTILFLLVFYGYFAALSAPGAWGALRLALWTVRRGLARDRVEVMRRQHAALGAPEEGPTAALNLALERSDGLPFRIDIRDSAGSHGAMEVDGARLSHLEAPSGGSADLVAYFARQVSEVLGREVSIVIWGQIDDDEAVRYLAQVQFARNLARHLGSPPLWPTALVTPEQCEELRRRLEIICPALRDEALLPDWEYSAEHKLPVIPEPLGFVSLGRSAKRADPLATMGFAALMVLCTLAVIVLFVIRPPWVPG